MNRLPLVTSSKPLLKLCEDLKGVRRLALDTEFVPEYTYAPKLCLVQIATDELSVAIDPLTVKDLSPLWALLLDPGREIVVHAGQAEMEFCLRATGQIPPSTFDVQIAAGLTGDGYPLSYKRLTQRILGLEAADQQTRTDWRKRPLSDDQLDYALDDVEHLLTIRDRLGDKLKAMGRVAWLDDEMARARARLLKVDTEQPWRRVAGGGSLDRRELAVLAELALWRDGRAKALDKPIRQILRDDLLVELARRKPRSADAVQRVRGVGNLNHALTLEEIVSAVARGVATPEADCPFIPRRNPRPGEAMILKLLSAVMLHLAECHAVAPQLLGSNEDLTRLLDWRDSGQPPGKAPHLARGWRAELCGRSLTDFLSGQTCLRLDCATAEPTLDFVRSPS